jgi:AMP-binding enzyme
MLGLMQNQPLLISNLIDFAERHHADGEIVSRRVEGDIHRYTWGDVAKRSRQVAHALDGLKLEFSDRVATLAWNGYRHLELYFGVSGSGRVLHTLNPRLHPDQVVWIANHAEDKVLCFDMTFLPIVQAVHARCPMIKTYVALCLRTQGFLIWLVMRLGWVQSPQLMSGHSLMKTALRRCVTPVAQQVIPKQRSIRIARPRCMPMRRRCLM